MSKKRSSLHDCPNPTGQSRWYRDGYCARLNGKPLSANPRFQKKIDRWGRVPLFTVKAKRWQHGWEDADVVVKGMVEWDETQEVIDALDGELKEDAV